MDEREGFSVGRVHPIEIGHLLTEIKHASSTFKTTVSCISGIIHPMKVAVHKIPFHSLCSTVCEIILTYKAEN